MYHIVAATGFYLDIFKSVTFSLRIKKNSRPLIGDSHAGFVGYVLTEGESSKKNLRIKKISGYVWIGPQCCSQFKPFGNETFCSRYFHIV